MSNSKSDSPSNLQTATLTSARKDPIRHVQHELRTPLNHILGFSELLIEEIRSTDFEALTPGLKKIYNSGKFILSRVTETFTTIGGSNWIEILESLRQDVRVYAQQISVDTEKVKEQAIALGSISELNSLEEIRKAAGKLDTLADDAIQALEATFQPENPSDSQQGSNDKQSHVQTNSSTSILWSRPVGAVLVVDDNEANREMLSHSLRRQGHSVSVAENGRKALEQISTQNFDLVLLDIMMPEMTGYQVLETMKADESVRHIPVIMISGVDDLQGVVKCIEMGAEDHLHKPFDAVLLRAQISASLEKKRLRDQEILYLAQVEQLMAAAAAVEAGTFSHDSLDDIAARSDNLGQLARVFQHMAQEVSDREQRLRQEVHELRIQIDEGWMQEKIDEITDTEYFHRLENMANELREES